MPTRAVASPARTVIVPARPGADLKKELSRIARVNDTRAGVVLTWLGSLTRAVISLADSREVDPKTTYRELAIRKR